MKAEPVFTVDKSGKSPVVWLHCSNCNEKIRQIEDNESIKVTQGYYCSECDDGAHHINFPVKSDA